MKKIIIIAAVILCAVGIFFGVRALSKDQTTDSSKWETVYHSEFSVTLPKNMKSSDKLFKPSFGEQIAMYSNSEVTFSVAKISYSYNPNLKDIDIKTFMSSITVDNEKITPIAIGDGYYSATYRNSSPDKEGDLFNIEALFKGSDAIYSIATYCDTTKRSDYEASMLEWIESFRIR